MSVLPASRSLPALLAALLCVLAPCLAFAADDPGSVHLGAFTDVTAGVDSATSAPGFAIGAVDLFLTGDLGERFSALAETVFEADATGHVGLDVERASVRWTWGDAFSLTAGRVHQTLGLYNTAFHHGKFLMTAATRPRVVAFEDDGGVLPAHLVGLSAAGQLSGDALALDWVLEVGNGRGTTPDHVLSAGDLDLAKSVNAQLSLWLKGIDLRLGANLLWDQVRGVTDGDAPRPAFTEWIAGAHLQWQRSTLKVLAEGYWVRHLGGPISTVTLGAFGEAELALGRWTPFLRVETLRFGAVADPFFSPTTPRPDVDAVVAGVRFDAGPKVALKLQGQLGRTGGVLGGGALTQAAFSF